MKDGNIQKCFYDTKGQVPGVLGTLTHWFPQQDLSSAWKHSFQWKGHILSRARSHRNHLQGKRILVTSKPAWSPRSCVCTGLLYMSTWMLRLCFPRKERNLLHCIIDVMKCNLIYINVEPVSAMTFLHRTASYHSYIQTHMQHIYIHIHKHAVLFNLKHKHVLKRDKSDSPET